MFTFPLPAALLAAAPGVAERLAAILARLAALIARAFLRHPRHVAVIVPLWNYLGRIGRRFARAMDRVDLPRRPAGTRPGRPSGKPHIKLPCRRAWLVEELRHEAVAYALHLEALLAEPEAAALLAASPHARRILRPICHLLGIAPDCLKRSRTAPPVESPSSCRNSKGEARSTGTPPPAPEPTLGPRPVQPLCPRLANRWPFVPHPGMRRA